MIRGQAGARSVSSPQNNTRAGKRTRLSDTVPPMTGATGGARRPRAAGLTLAETA